MGYKQRIVKAMSKVMSLEGWFDIQGIDHNLARFGIGNGGSLHFFALIARFVKFECE